MADLLAIPAAITTFTLGFFELYAKDPHSMMMSSIGVWLLAMDVSLRWGGQWEALRRTRAGRIRRPGD
jgi:hypothetical protein